MYILYVCKLKFSKLIADELVVFCHVTHITNAFDDQRQ